MKPSLRPGASRVNRFTVNRERTISFMGEEARTYATPSMILDIEHTCRELILEHADAGEDSVGMEVAIKHLAPTLMGMTVEITVSLRAGVPVGAPVDLHARFTHREGRKAWATGELLVEDVVAADATALYIAERSDS